MSINRQLSSFFLVLILAAFGLTACNRGSVEAAREDRSPTVSASDQEFMMKATLADLAEINMARLALQKTDNFDVRDYANMIQSDHTHALEDLTDLMRGKTAPQPKTMAADTKKDIDRMNLLTGPEFDREFVNMMVMDHQKAAEMFRDQSMAAEDPDLKKYADNTLPTLEMHLDKAQRLQSKLFRGPREHPSR